MCDNSTFHLPSNMAAITISRNFIKWQKKTRISWKFSIRFRSQIEKQEALVYSSIHTVQEIKLEGFLQQRSWQLSFQFPTCLFTYIYIWSGCGRVVYGAGRKAKRMVLQCINGEFNTVEGRTKIWQLKNLILTLFGLIFRHI